MPAGQFMQLRLQFMTIGQFTRRKRNSFFKIHSRQKKGSRKQTKNFSGKGEADVKAERLRTSNLSQNSSCFDALGMTRKGTRRAGYGLKKPYVFPRGD